MGIKDTGAGALCADVVLHAGFSPGMSWEQQKVRRPGERRGVRNQSQIVIVGLTLYVSDP